MVGGVAGDDVTSHAPSEAALTFKFLYFLTFCTTRSMGTHRIIPGGPV